MRHGASRVAMELLLTPRRAEPRAAPTRRTLPGFTLGGPLGFGLEGFKPV